ncbi:MAG: TonB-dependent receptor [Saprospiraceae bacterium]|nr:TonB-dependent receptor [Saprospiraceae bacterium]MBK8849932.1 TonB-dependent receptor [Saprospiraceae bacterium]MBL0081697.1 TonB-dependent receptor [Saprospiraceae bacterium]
MTIRNLIPCLLFFVSLSVSAQVKKYTVKGLIQDNEKTPLIGASVVLLNPVDSVLVAFGTSDEKGLFEIKNVKSDSFKIQITYLGFGTLEKIIFVGGENAILDQGAITMFAADNMLDEVVVKSEYIPIAIKKDTIEYNADAYRVRPNATVEELLKKLPGIEVDASGTITAQGEEIKKVMVDGKKFFGDDPKMATQNLPADAIKKVQVFDKKSEKAEFTGVSDGESEKVLNLELKADKKIGTFGEVMAGYGTEDRFDSKLSFNKFNNKYQFSTLANFNNLSNQGFSFSDYNTLMGGNAFGGRGGGSMNSGVVNFGNTNTGQIKSATAGLNFYYEFSPKFNLTTSYFLSHSDQDLIKDKFRQNFQVENSFASDEFSTSNTVRNGHTVNLAMQIKPDSFHRIDLESSVRFNGSDAITSSLTNASSLSGVPRNSIDQSDKNINDLTDLSLRGVFTKRLRKPGRIFSLEASYGNTENETDYFLDRTSLFYTNNLLDSILQDQISLSDNNNYRIYTEYKEPLGKKNYLGLGYSKRNYRSLQNKDFYTVDFLDPNKLTLNELLSSLSDNNVGYDRASLIYTKDDEKYSINVDLVYQRSLISGSDDNPGSVPLEKVYNYFLPSFTVNWIDKNLRIRYNTSINEPSVTQLQPIVNNSDPLNLYQGNPALKPEYAHSVNIRYSFFDNFNFRNFFAFLNLRYTKDKIITAQTINNNLITTSLPINTNNQQNASLNFTYSSPIRALKVKARVFGGGSVTQSINFVNTIENEVITLSPRMGLELENTNNKYISLMAAYEASYSENQYSVNTTQNASYLTHVLRSNLLLNFGKGWNLDSDINHTIYTGETFAEAVDLTLFNASLSKRLFNDRLTAKLRAADIFNAGQGISRSAGDTYVEEVTTNGIGRYFLFSLTYRLSGFSPNQTGGQGPPRMMMIRN